MRNRKTGKFLPWVLFGLMLTPSAALADGGWFQPAEQDWMLAALAQMFHGLFSLAGLGIESVEGLFFNNAGADPFLGVLKFIGMAALMLAAFLGGMAVIQSLMNGATNKQLLQDLGGWFFIVRSTVSTTLLIPFIGGYSLGLVLLAALFGYLSIGLAHNSWLSYLGGQLESVRNSSGTAHSVFKANTNAHTYGIKMSSPEVAEFLYRAYSGEACVVGMATSVAEAKAINHYSQIKNHATQQYNHSVDQGIAQIAAQEQQNSNAAGNSHLGTNNSDAAKDLVNGGQKDGIRVVSPIITKVADQGNGQAITNEQNASAQKMKDTLNALFNGNNQENTQNPHEKSKQALQVDKGMIASAYKDIVGTNLDQGIASGGLYTFGLANQSVTANNQANFSNQFACGALNFNNQPLIASKGAEMRRSVIVNNEQDVYSKQSEIAMDTARKHLSAMQNGGLMIEAYRVLYAGANKTNPSHNPNNPDGSVGNSWGQVSSWINSGISQASRIFGGNAGNTQEGYQQRLHELALEHAHAVSKARMAVIQAELALQENSGNVNKQHIAQLQHTLQQTIANENLKVAKELDKLSRQLETSLLSIVLQMGRKDSAKVGVKPTTDNYFTQYLEEAYDKAKKYGAATAGSYFVSLQFESARLQKLLKIHPEWDYTNAGLNGVALSSFDQPGLISGAIGQKLNGTSMSVNSYTNYLKQFVSQATNNPQDILTLNMFHTSSMRGIGQHSAYPQLFAFKTEPNAATRKRELAGVALGLNLESLSDMNRHPLIIAIEAGQKMLAAATGNDQSLTDILNANKPSADGKNAGVGPDGSSSFQKHALVGLMIATGFALAYVLPAMPLIYWIGMMLSVVVGFIMLMFGTPFALALHIAEGSRWAGKSGGYYSHLIGTIARFPAAVFGFIAAMVIIDVFGRMFVFIYGLSIGLFQYQDNPTFEAYAGGTFAELLGIVGVYLIFLIALWQIIQKSIMMGSTIADQLPTLFGGSPGNTTETANYIAGPEMNSKIQQVGSNVGSMISSQQDNRVTHVVSDKVVGTTNASSPVVGTANEGKLNPKGVGKDLKEDAINSFERKKPSSDNSEPINSNKPTANQ